MEGKRGVGRPSLAEQRIGEILDAYARCVARYGVEGTTLQLVADEAGMARGNVRHYVGNREALRRLFGKRLADRYAGRAQTAAGRGPVGQQSETLVRYFFGTDVVPNNDYAAIDALFAAARYDEGLRRGLRVVYEGLESLVAASLTADHPGRAAEVYADAAYQILVLAYGHWTLSELGFPAARSTSALRGALDIIARVAAAPVLRPNQR